MKYFLFVLFSVYTFTVSCTEYVTTHLMGQFGNQLFQIAAAYAYSLDHNIPLLLPNLKTDTSNNIPFNAEKLFLRNLSTETLPSPPSIRWAEPSFNYHPIPVGSTLSLFGYFQSHKYFEHRRKELLELFSPPEELKNRILSKYPFLQSSALTVGIQIRDYRKEQPNEEYHPTQKRSYYAKAMDYFPDNAIFLVSSNNSSFAKECVEGLKPNIIFLQEQDYIEEFYALSFCSSFIISNSTFGWWASWLSENPEKKVIAPYNWFSLPYNNKEMVKDLFRDDFILIYE